MKRDRMKAKPEITDDPFSPEADPDRPVRSAASAGNGESAAPCFCRDGLISRRGVLVLGGLAATLPLVARAEPMVPCVQESQRITPCQHKFCKHFGGGRDYHGR